MNRQPIDSANQTENLLSRIHKGMEVYDLTGEKVGEVKDLYFGADSGSREEYSAGAASAPSPQIKDNGLVEDIAKALGGEPNIPEELRERLLNNGYILVEGEGLFGADRYILTEQIARVHDDHVHLRVARRDLIKG